MTEIDIRTSWNDSGYDCDHCGGRILERIDQETGQPDQVCFQCELCGCQWTPKGDVLRVGQSVLCQQAQMDRAADIQIDGRSLAKPILLVVAGVIVLLLLVVMGGLVAIRFLIPVAIFVFMATAVYRFGHDRQWW